MTSGRQTKVTGSFEASGRRALATLLCLSLVLGFLMPLKAHAVTASDTAWPSLEVQVEHDHPHDLEEAIHRLVHGHHHDAADHEHAQALLGPGNRHHPTPDDGGHAEDRPLAAGPPRAFRIERPPRA